MILLSTTKRQTARDLLSATDQSIPHFKVMEIGQLIAQARYRKNLSQRALASAIGVNPSAVAQWEGGATLPTGANMAAVRRVLEIDQVIAPSDGAPFSGELIDDPDELALLRFWRGLDEDERRFMLKRLMSGPPPPRKPPTRQR